MLGLYVRSVASSKVVSLSPHRYSIFFVPSHSVSRGLREVENRRCNVTSRNLWCNITSANLWCNVTSRNLRCNVTSRNLRCNVTSRNLRCNVTSRNLRCNVTSRNLRCNVTSRNLRCNVTSHKLGAMLPHTTCGAMLHSTVLSNQKKNKKTQKFSKIKILAEFRLLHGASVHWSVFKFFINLCTVKDSITGGYLWFVTSSQTQYSEDNTQKMK